jgi:uncharacterized protein involved in exopolysaccharide biosynthesis
MRVAELDRSIEAMAAKLLRVVWHHILVFLFSAGTIFCILMVGVLSQQPTYEGAALLIGGQTNLGQVLEKERRDAETPVALLTRIAESDVVLQAAIEDVGLENVAPSAPPAGPSLSFRLRQLLFPTRQEPEREAPPIEVALARARAALTIRGDDKASVIRIAYRHADPAIAASFANALAKRFIERQVFLYSRFGVADFFLQQRQRFEQDARQATEALRAFSTRTAIFSIADQRDLVLKRRDILAQAVASTRGDVAQKMAERQMMAEGLRQLAPVTRSPLISSLVESFGGERVAGRKDSRAVDDRLSDPPLLLVRVYQDTMVALFKVNADLKGAESLLAQQTTEMAKATAELAALAESEEEFTRLKRDVDQASRNLELYAKRMVEEQIDAEMSTARFSSVRVLQPARPPARPSGPNLPILALIAAAAGILGGVVMALLLEKRGAGRQPRVQPAPHAAPELTVAKRY